MILEAEYAFRIFLLAMAARSLLKCVFVSHFLRWLDRAQSIGPQQLEADRRLIILVPVLDEARTVEQCVSHFHALTRDANDVEVIFVGTERERDETAVNPTLIACESAIRRANWVQCQALEAPVRCSNRAGQLNYAMMQIEGRTEKLWVLTADVDSRFGQNGLAQIIRAVNEDAAIIHQPALFLENLALVSPWDKGQAIYQSRWTIAHECFRMSLNACSGVVGYHLVGHGLCIKRTLLKRMGEFPEWAILEDVALGYLCAASGEKVRLLPTFEMADSPSTVAEGFWQLHRWASGVQQYWSFYRALRAKRPRMTISEIARALLYASQGIAGSISWNLSSYVFLLAVGCAWYGYVPALLFLGVYYAEFFICVGYFRLRRYITTRDLLLTPFWLTIEFAKRSVPANFALLRAIFGFKPMLFKAHH